MAGLPDSDDPRCFWQASVEEAATELAKIIEEVAADVIVTYNANGFYGHPDHIQAHRVAWRARALAGRDAKFYAIAMPRSVLAAAVELPEDSWFARIRDLSVSVPDDQVTTEIDATPYLAAKLAAMAAHETQITLDGEFYALSNELGQRALGTEYYTLLAAPSTPSTPSTPSSPSASSSLSASSASSASSARPGGEGGARRPGGPFERDLFAR